MSAPSDSGQPSNLAIQPEPAGPGAAQPVARSFADRLRRTQARMVELGVDALLVSRGGDLPWLTGYAAMPLERLTMLVIRPEETPVLLVPALEEARVHRFDNLFSVRPWFDVEEPLDLVVELVGSGSDLIGLSDQAWARTLLGLQDRMPGTRFTIASAVTAPIRAVKDELEMEMLSKAGRAADEVARAVQASEVLFVGRTEAAVAREIAERLIAGGHDRVDFTIVASGPNGASPHHDSGERVIQRGEAVVCDFGGQVLVPGTDVGYCSDITRTVVTGPVPPEIERCYQVLQQAQEAGVQAALSGVPAEQVDRAARAVIAAAGLGDAFIHRTGHGIGVETHEDPYVVEGNASPLVAGNVFSVEPGIYIPGRFGMRLEDIVAATVSGPVRLNNAAHELVSIDR